MWPQWDACTDAAPDPPAVGAVPWNGPGRRRIDAAIHGIAMTQPHHDASNASIRPLRVLSTLAVRAVLEDLAERPDGLLAGATVELAPTAVLLDRVAAGERADIGILTAAGIDDLVAQGVMAAGSRVDLARSPIGLAVGSGAPHPPIGTLDELIATLRAAPSFVYSRAGASGIFLAALLDRLGLAAELGRKATVIPSGFTAEVVARGEAALAIQQVSELLVVPGIEVVGPLPDGAQQISTFAAGVFAGSSEHAHRLARSLADRSLDPLYEAAGLIPAGAPP